MLRIVLLMMLGFGWIASAGAIEPLDELRASFTIGGEPIPPEIFGDFGDAMISDNRPIIVTIDALAAMHSNRYADPIKVKDRWVEQAKPQSGGINGPEAMAYQFIGTTDNGLLVVVASWTGGGTGVFYTLHVVDAASANAFDEDGTTYRRLNLTLVRSYILGDRWQGDVSITGHTIHIVTTASRAERALGPVTLQAVRP
ncbi:MAG TPA: hypothetical protein VG986_19315 [Pseudolabrys sp.]|nr:hypothetical protein [Pseudolabrys sp.]